VVHFLQFWYPYCKSDYDQIIFYLPLQMHLLPFPTLFPSGTQNKFFWVWPPLGFKHREITQREEVSLGLELLSFHFPTPSPLVCSVAGCTLHELLAPVRQPFPPSSFCLQPQYPLLLWQNVSLTHRYSFPLFRQSTKPIFMILDLATWPLDVDCCMEGKEQKCETFSAWFVCPCCYCSPS
jgi:hypothetical protein